MNWIKSKQYGFYFNMDKFNMCSVVKNGDFYDVEFKDSHGNKLISAVFTTENEAEEEVNKMFEEEFMPSEELIDIYKKIVSNQDDDKVSNDEIIMWRSRFLTEKTTVDIFCDPEKCKFVSDVFMNIPSEHMQDPVKVLHNVIESEKLI